MALKLNETVALVTGASSGIGAATATELARRGARVVLVARRADRLAQLVAAITDAGGAATALSADVSDIAGLGKLAEDAADVYGRVDALINNAGIGTGKSYVNTDPAAITQMVSVNLLAPLMLTRLLLPGMLERKRGAIVCIASVAGHVAIEPLYSATKFGLRGFALSLRREIRASGVNVSVVSPGFIRTELTASMRGRLPGPGVVANTIAGLLTHPRREVVIPGYYNGAIAVEAIAPWVVDQAVRGRM
ncbi:MAG TPA: SDR family NAD(P)-dependent oxidoreductase [Ktedonobacterales bacterium]